MATLSHVKREFITIAKWAGLIFGVLLAIVILFKFAFFVKEAISPTPPTPPTVAFGRLPAIFFHDGIKKNFSYTIDTLTGDLPVFSDRGRVYLMTSPQPDILAIENASGKISHLGFNSNPEKLSDIIYRWTTPKPPVKSLILNVNAAQFTLSSDYLTNPQAVSSTDLMNEDDSISAAKEFLQTLELYPEDIDEAKTKTDLLSVKNGIISGATSLSQANLISVFFFQKDLDDMPMVYPSGSGSTMNFTVTGSRSSIEVVDASFFYQKRLDKFETYPIKTSLQAFEELKKGEGYIASYDGENLNIVIKKVYLAYYSEGQEQKYLTPVVVFEGTGNFMAYVPAVMAPWSGN